MCVSGNTVSECGATHWGAAECQKRREVSLLACFTLVQSGLCFIVAVNLFSLPLKLCGCYVKMWLNNMQHHKNS